MYVGKDKNGRYNFKDNGKSVLTRDLLERANITIDKEYDTEIAEDIYSKYKKEQEEKKPKHKEKLYR